MDIIKTGDNYVSEQFYEKIPILNSFDDYTLEEVSDKCIIPVSRIDNLDKLLEIFQDKKIVYFEVKKIPHGYYHLLYIENT
ncbi:TPA: hypothetical protein ACRUL4_002496 [Legionella pneumophila]|nr:hypothetical protein [Legionella pneumophila]HAT1883611.1 hypothetical protein [Legionella pneumophila]HAT2115331.1 hypothetical protein [Legionella pneumophila]HAT8721528.1 hypothetical protein [Legionella pneumophila]